MLQKKTTRLAGFEKENRQFFFSRASMRVRRLLGVRLVWHRGGLEDVERGGGTRREEGLVRGGGCRPVGLGEGW
jgi:hypothetical protein